MLSPFQKSQSAEEPSYVSSQKLYAVIDAVQAYNAQIEKTDNTVVDRLAEVLASKMIIDYSAIENQLATASSTIEISAYFIDYTKAYLKNNTEFDFSAYSQYITNLSSDAMNQVYNIVLDESLYTVERKISITFVETDDELNQIVEFNEDDMNIINDECYSNAQKIYSDYISKSDMSTAFLLDSIKNLPLDNIVDIYNRNNPESQIQEQQQKDLFAAYAKHYVSSMIIDNILKSSSDSKTYKASINYQIEHGDTTITHVFNNLLQEYYVTKQPPVDKLTVTSGFENELASYAYDDSADLYSKTFEFTYTQNLNEFIINDDFYAEIVNDIYEEYAAYTAILDNFYPMMENKYFFVERPFAGTTIIYNNTGDTRYRQLNINVTGPTDCYVKLYSYNTSTDTYDEVVLITYIKSGDSLQVFLGEGDYVFKYATGAKWYGDVHMFSDDGQYFAGSNVISVHEYMMTTTIELGTFEDGSVSANSQTPEEF